MEGHRVVPGDGAQRALGPGRRAAVRVPREHQPSQQARRNALRILLRTAHRGRDLLARPRELGVQEGGAQQGVRQEVKAEPDILPEDGQHDLARVPATLALEASADELDGAVALRRGASRAPPSEEERGQIGEALLVLRVEDRASVH